MLNTLTKELKVLAADAKIWIGILLVLIIIIIGTSYNRKNTDDSAVKPLKLGVINKDDSAYSQLLLDYFNGSETFSSLITVIIGEENEIRREFSDGALDIFIEIPESFSENMIRLENSPITVTYNIEDTTKALLFRNVLESYEKYISAVEVNAVGLYNIMEEDGMDRKLIDDTNVTISLDMIFTALGKEEFFNLKPVEKFPSTKVSEYYLMAILAMAVLYGGLYAGFGILKEMRQGTFIRLKTTKTSVISFLAAKIFLLTLVFTAVCVTALHMITGRRVAAVILFGLSISLFSALAAALLSVFFKTTQRFILIGNLLVFFFCVVGGGIIPVQFLPEDMIRLAKMTPLYYMIKGMSLLLQEQTVPLNRIMAGFFIISILMFSACAASLNVRSVAYEEA